MYFFINLVAEYYPKESEAFFRRHRSRFQREHEEDVRALSSISLPDHLLSNPTVQVYRNNRYRLTLSNVAHHNLIMFLESKERDGGAVVINVIQSCMNLIAVERAALSTDHSLATILARKTTEDELPAEDEGVPGHNPGSANTEPGAHPVLPKLALGPMPKEPELMEDVKAQVQEEDEKHPPVEGQPSLAEEFEKQIKEEQTEDAPSRDNIPLPPSLARDIAVEVQKIKENRERFKIERRTGGVGPGLSVTMLTFHNTYDRYKTCRTPYESARVLMASITASTVSTSPATISWWLPELQNPM